jgi:hypothetical protein
MNRGATIVFALTRLGHGSYPGSAGRRIAPLCSGLHHRDMQMDVCVIRLFAAKTRHTGRLHNFPITGRSDRRNVSTSHRRSLRKPQFLDHGLEARLLAQGIH